MKLEDSKAKEYKQWEGPIEFIGQMRTEVKVEIKYRNEKRFRQWGKYISNSLLHVHLKRNW